MQPPKAADAPDAEPHPDETPAPAGKPGADRDEAGADRAEAGPDRDEAGPDRDEAGKTPGYPAGSTLSSAAEEQAERVSGDEPLLAARVHRPSDLMRLLIGVLAIVVLFSIAAFAHGTTTGLEQDINKGTGQAPDVLIKMAGLVSSIAVLLVPVAFAIERLIKRDGLRIADGVLAAVLAHGVTLAADLWVAKSAPGTIQDALTQPQPGDALTDPVHGYLAPVIAYMTAVGMARRPRWRVVLWVVLLLDAFAMLVGGYTTPFSIILTVLIGWTVAYGTLYAVGSPNVRPTGQHLMAGLRHVGFRPVSAMRADDAPDSGDQSDRGRRYLVSLEDGPPLDVTVVDREQQAHGFFYRVWRRLTLRGITQRRSIQSLRQALEQEALLAYAAIAAGANAPKLIATSELGPDAVMLVYEHIGGRSLDALEDAEITDELLHGAWRQVKALQSRRIAHRRLTGDAILVDRSGKVFVTDLRGGEIAAGDLVLRMDVAQLLTTTGLRVGAERAVAGALAVLGPDAVADCLPLLQPIALSRSTRAALRRLARERSQREREAVLEASDAAKRARAHEHGAASGTPDDDGRRADRKKLRNEKQAEKRALDDALEGAREEDLLSQMRQQVLLIRPQAPVEPVRLERIKPRTLLSCIAGAIAAYFLISQVTQADFGTVVEQAEWGWVAAAVGFSALTYVAAAMSLLGFVPERVSFGRTVLAQVAGSFVKIVAPAAVGGVALNTRFLQRAGVRPGARRGERRRLAAVRPRLPHPAAGGLRLSDRYGEDPVLAHPVQDGDRRTADRRRAGAGGDGGPVPAEVRGDPGAVAVRRSRAAHARRGAAAAEAADRHRRNAAADRAVRDVPGRFGTGLQRSRRAAPQLRQHRGGLPRRQRAGVGGAHTGRNGRGRGRADAGSDRGRSAEGGRGARRGAVPPADALAAGASRLALLHPSDPQGRALTTRRAQLRQPRRAQLRQPAGPAPTTRRVDSDDSSGPALTCPQPPYGVARKSGRGTAGGSATRLDRCPVQRPGSHRTMGP
ncbi:hypothetical protein ACVWYT_006282 [Streptomyces sp. TE4109]